MRTAAFLHRIFSSSLVVLSQFWDKLIASTSSPKSIAVIDSGNCLLKKLNFFFEKTKKWFSGADLDKENKQLSAMSKDMRIVKFAHFSVKEYLVSDKIRSGLAKSFAIKEKSAHLLIAEQSLAYIFYYVKAKQGGCRGNPSDLAQFPLLAYSYFNFWDHTRAVPVPERRSVVSTIYQLMNSNDTFLILRNLRHPAQRSYEGPFCWADGSTDITMPRTMM
jgi:hypothetical protein